MPADALIPPSLPSSNLLPPPSAQTRIAPIWHTAILVVGILAFSIWGAMRSAGAGSEPMTTLKGSRLLHYAMTGVLELVVVGWVALGMRLHRTPFRTLFGIMPRGFNAIVKEAGAAALFWICSMVVLGVVGLAWNVIQTQTYHHQLSKQTPSAHAPAPESPQQQKIKLIRKLMELAPGTVPEILAWGLLCIAVGFSEELIFRGYLQQQGIALLRGVPLGVIFSALVFGAAHAYEGTTGMVQIAIFGALFSAITLIRRNLLPGMIAHTWHDFATGMFLALIRETHLLDRIPLPS